MYCDKFDNDFNAICHHVRRSNVTEESLEGAKVIEYHVYDMVNEGLRFSERICFLTDVAGLLNNVTMYLTPR